MENLTESVVFVSLNIKGQDVPFITDAVAVSWIIMAVLIACALILTRKLKDQPGKRQNAAEIIVESITGLCKNTIGHHWEGYVPYIGTVLLYLIACNLAGIFNIIPTGKFLAEYLRLPGLSRFEFPVRPPTKNFNVTLCLALMSMAIVVFSEFRYKGLKGWARSFYHPMPINGFVKVLDYVIRPTSLCLRLFGNILGGFIVIELVYAAFPPAAPAIAGIYFDLFDGSLQAYVFVFLTMVYLQEAVETE